MRKTTRLTILVVALSLGPVAWGQEAAPGGDSATAREPTESELLRAALEELIALLKQSLDMQEVGVLLRRLELTEARVAPLRAEVNDATEKVRSIEEETIMLRSEVDRVNEMLFRAEGEAGEEEVRGMRSQREYAKTRLQMLGRQEAMARQALIDLESQLERELARIRALNEWVDERLGL